MLYCVFCKLHINKHLKTKQLKIIMKLKCNNGYIKISRDKMETVFQGFHTVREVKSYNLKTSYEE